MKCWYNPILMEDFQVDLNFGIYVKRHYEDFDIDKTITLHMKRAFARGIDKEYLPEELNPDSLWTEDSAWEQLAINRNFVKVDNNIIVANDLRWIWLTLKALALEGYLNFDSIEIQIPQIDGDVLSYSLPAQIIKMVLNMGIKSLEEYLAK